MPRRSWQLLFCRRNICRKDFNKTKATQLLSRLPVNFNKLVVSNCFCLSRHSFLFRRLFALVLIYRRRRVGKITFLQTILQIMKLSVAVALGVPTQLHSIPTQYSSANLIYRAFLTFSFLIWKENEVLILMFFFVWGGNKKKKTN